jgi:hypothetical protein
MNYDAENDRFISEFNANTLHPNASTFPECSAIEVNVGDDTIEVPVEDIDDLCDGLQKAKRKARNEPDTQMFLIQGRLAEDDEDEVRIVEAPSMGEAEVLFEQELRSIDNEPDGNGDERALILVLVESLETAVLGRITRD